MTTTTTEILSNSSSSCRLLVCLNSLPFQDQRVFRSQLGHIELVRLSACCHSLRSSIRDDRALWQERYHKDFLSGAHYDKEMEFVLWCIRTDINNPCISDKRADLLENVDWYNTYRRRVSTENNWRYGRCNTTHIDMERDEHGDCYSTEAEDNSSDIIEENCSDETPNYSLEYLPHSNFRSNHNNVYNSTFSTSPNILLLDAGNENDYASVGGDHYIAVFPYASESNTDSNVKILSCKHGGVITTFDVPARYQLDTIEGNWVLLAHQIVGLSRDLRVYGVMVFDIENSIMCPGSIDDTWNAVHFYKTTNDTAIVYTARLVNDDDTNRIEWALHQFSSNNPVVRLRSGWFQLPVQITKASIFSYNSYDSHIMLQFGGHPDYNPYIIHSVASSGQSHTPRNCYDIYEQHMPTPLLRAGCRYSMFDCKPPKVWTDLSYNDDQVIQIPGTDFIKHIIGDLYVFITKDHNDIGSQLLVDISTKEIIRKLEVPNTGSDLPDYTMAGTIYDLDDSDVQVIQEYGEL